MAHFGFNALSDAKACHEKDKSGTAMEKEHLETQRDELYKHHNELIEVPKKCGRQEPQNKVLIVISAAKKSKQARPNCNVKMENGTREGT